MVHTKCSGSAKWARAAPATWLPLEGVSLDQSTPACIHTYIHAVQVYSMRELLTKVYDDWLVFGGQLRRV